MAILKLKPLPPYGFQELMDDLRQGIIVINHGPVRLRVELGRSRASALEQRLKKIWPPVSNHETPPAPRLQPFDNNFEGFDP